MSAKFKLKEWFQQKRDDSVSFVAEKVLAKRLEPYGRLMDFHLESAANRAKLVLLLKGETEPITVSVDSYRLNSTAEQTDVTVLSASASREWVTLLLQDFLVGRTFEIPEKYAGFAKVLL